MSILTPSPPPGVQFERIAHDLAQRIRRGEFATGDAMPATTALADHYDVSRGTVRHALERVEEQHALLMRRGSRWIVHEPAQPHSFSVLRSFAQWALATGHRPSGRTVSLERGLATRLEAIELGIRYRERVLRCVRVRALDDKPVMVERTTYLNRLADVIGGLPDDTPSVMQVLERDHDITLAHAEHRISATVATGAEESLLGVGRGAPLLRVRRTGRSADGQAFEYSDDRYIADAIELSIINSN